MKIPPFMSWLMVFGGKDQDLEAKCLSLGSIICHSLGATWNLGMWLKPLGPLIVAQILEADFQHGKLLTLFGHLFLHSSIS